MYPKLAGPKFSSLGAKGQSSTDATTLCDRCLITTLPKG